jgi:hypothetical protein
MPTATIGRAFRKVMNGGEAKFKAAIESLRAVLNQRIQIEEFYRGVATLLSGWETRVRDAAATYQRALASRDLAAVKEALEAWLLLRIQLDFVRHEQANLRTSEMGALAQVFTPNVKVIMLTVSELKLRAAQADAKRVTDSEAARLGATYSRDDVAESPVVRRAQSKVRHLEFVKNRIATESIASCWSLATGLLEDE